MRFHVNCFSNDYRILVFIFSKFQGYLLDDKKSKRILFKKYNKIKNKDVSKSDIFKFYETVLTNLIYTYE